jgi:hypothetical protein
MALTPLDDSLWHQIPSAFDHVGTSDPRFYDRFWFAGFDPDGRGAFQLTMGSYSNMNVLDAAIAVVIDDEQHNLRVSRALRPDFQTACGPISVDVREPLDSFGLVVAPGEQSVHGQVEWTSTMAPEEEEPHFRRIRGRVSEDYRRFNQVGRCNGRLEVGGRQIDITDWWGCRDHSWGVRPRMGIPEPRTGKQTSLDERGFMLALLFFSTTKLGGHLHVQERGDRRVYGSGILRDREAPIEHEVEEIDLRIGFHRNSRRFRRVEFEVETFAGPGLNVDATAMGNAFAQRGLGYSGGYDDEAGLGAWRGDLHIEHDVWDVGEPGVIGYASGERKPHWHWIQPVSIEAEREGERSQGVGSLTLLASGNLPNLSNITIPDDRPPRGSEE